MLRLFVDTSAWFAFANRDDPDHKTVATLLGKPRGRLITSNFILDETVTLCLYRLGHSVAEKVGRVLLDSASVDLLRITPKMRTQPGSCFASARTRRTASPTVRPLRSCGAWVSRPPRRSMMTLRARASSRCPRESDGPLGSLALVVMVGGTGIEPVTLPCETGVKGSRINEQSA